MSVNILENTPTNMTPMLKQYLDVKARHQDAILFFRMGDFYEMFFDDAKLAAPLLDIALTSRDRKSENPVPMCGVPFHSADSYIAKLMEHGMRVAICEQLEDPRFVKGIVKRDVVRVITPGTYMPEHAAEQTDSQGCYVAAVVAVGDVYGISFCDIGTGDWQATMVGSIDELVNEMQNFRVRELIIPEADEDHKLSTLHELIGKRHFHTAIRRESLMLFHRAEETLLRHFSVRSVVGLGLQHEAIVQAAGALLGYLTQTQQVQLKHFDHIGVFSRQESMILDATTRLNLELVESATRRLGGQRLGTEQAPTLYGVLHCCMTAMGARLLQAWIERPLINRATIESRHQAVANLIGATSVLQTLRGELKEIRDLQRLLARVVLGRVSPRDLISLRESLGRLPTIRAQLAHLSAPLLQQLHQELDLLADLVVFLQTTLADEPPLQLQDGGAIRQGYNQELDELRGLESSGKDWLLSFERSERQRTGINNLKVRYNQVFGYYIEITRSNLQQVPADYQRKQTLVNAERFITPQLKEYEEKILSAAERILVLEQKLFDAVKSHVMATHQRLAKTAQVLAALDVLQSLATVALQNSYVQPTLVDDERLVIKEGRHPVVERYLNDSRYVPNDLLMNVDSRQLLILTGPNMAGKSTLLRQVALIVLMAQMGSFVPATSAEIGIVDRIFTRIGAADDIALGRSTFMVEMEEAANILRHATQKSLLILDEIGRGTSTYDGLSIAWAIVEYIHQQMKARTLFATHYHELIELGSQLSRAHNLHFSVKEHGERVIFLHRLLDGGVSRSYGIKVAKLAGLPETVISNAKSVLHRLESAKHVVETPTMAPQLGLFAPTPSIVESALQQLDVEALTPLQALNLLADMKSKVLK